MTVRIVFKGNEVPEEFMRAATIKDVVEVRKVGNKYAVFTRQSDYPKAYPIDAIAEFEVRA